MEPAVVLQGRSKLAHHFVEGKSVVLLHDASEEDDRRAGMSPNHGRESPKTRAGPVVTHVWAWGSTGEEKWNPDIEIGVDWKSLVRSVYPVYFKEDKFSSALLPITTDYFPPGKILREDYEDTEYNVLINIDPTKVSPFPSP